MTLEQVATLVQTAGVVFLLVASLFGLYKRWWVPGWLFSAVEKDRDFWRDTALRGMKAGEKVATVAESNLPHA